MRDKNIHGGGSKTTQNGLLFERETDLLTSLDEIEYLQVIGSKVFFQSKEVALVTEKFQFYKSFLNPLGVDEKKLLSKKLLPDSVVVNFVSREVFVIEKKFQEGAGSVDEKLQTCDFKLKQYQKLLAETEFVPSFIFLLNDWYSKPEYDDVKNYIRSVGCYYFIDEIPLKSIKLDFDSLY
jgi:hypothetical protein